MSKKRASADVIQAAMQSWILASHSHEGNCARCEAPVPIPLVSPRNGCNWTEGYAKSQPGCLKFMLEIVERAKAEYDLIS